MAAWRAGPLALRFGGSLLALRRGFRFGLGLQPLHGGLNCGQALLPARASSAGNSSPRHGSQGRVFRFVLLFDRRRDQEHSKLFAQALHSLFHMPASLIALCRDALPWIFVPSVATLPNCTSWPPKPEAHHLDKHLFEGLQMLLAKIADGPEVWTFLPHNRHECEIAFAGPRDLPARKHPDAVGIEQQTDHHGGIKRGGASRFRLIGGIEAA